MPSFLLPSRPSDASSLSALQQRTVGQSQNPEGAFQDPQGAEDAPAFRKEEQGQIQHRQHPEICPAMCQTGER